MRFHLRSWTYQRVLQFWALWLVLIVFPGGLLLRRFGPLEWTYSVSPSPEAEATTSQYAVFVPRQHTELTISVEFVPLIFLMLAPPTVLTLAWAFSRRKR